MDDGFVRARLAELHDDLVATAQTLVRADSTNPLNTTLVADAAQTLLQTQIPGIEVRRFEPLPGLVNLVATVSSGKPGRRLTFNGHLDTYPLLAELPWTHGPLSGDLTGPVAGHGTTNTTAANQQRIYGRGVCDMKGGIAAAIVAVRILAENRDSHSWAGDVTLTLAGDEETMGDNGSKWLLENVPEARGDANVCPDVGSPDVVRFGEKGFLFFEVTAVGKGAHGAHVHRGVNAVDRLRRALDAIKGLETALDTAAKAPPPAEVAQAMAGAQAISEALSGAGENDTLRRVTVNIGVVHGGTLPNLIPASARAAGDIRLPLGVSVADAMAYLDQHVTPMEGVTLHVTRTAEPSFTAPSHELVQAALEASRRVLGREVVANMRVGASDTRLHRPAGVPSVVVGLTPNGMGAEDEYVEVAELEQLTRILALTALRFLRPQ